jgi:hypothetical protein
MKLRECFNRWWQGTERDPHGVLYPAPHYDRHWTSSYAHLALDWARENSGKIFTAVLIAVLTGLVGWLF